MADKSEIKKALLKLDPGNPDHWTSDKSPRLEALGIDGLKRADVVKAAPLFNRDHPTFDLPSDEPEAVDGEFGEAQEPLVQMEASEFGSGWEETLTKELPPLPPIMESKKLAEVLAWLQMEETKTRDLKQLVVAREREIATRIVAVQERMGLEVSSRTNQERLMSFLKSTQQTKVPSRIDEAFQPQRDPTLQRPVRTNQGEVQ